MEFRCLFSSRLLQLKINHPKMSKPAFSRGTPGWPSPCRNPSSESDNTRKLDSQNAQICKQEKTLITHASSQHQFDCQSLINYFFKSN